MQSDWRLLNQMDYLYGVDLLRGVFAETASNDHEHCEFCMDKFSKADGDLKTGYCTLNRYWWICEECFNDFKEQFNWQVVDE